MGRSIDDTGLRGDRTNFGGLRDMRQNMMSRYVQILRQRMNPGDIGPITGPFVNPEARYLARLQSGGALRPTMAAERDKKRLAAVMSDPTFIGLHSNLGTTSAQARKGGTQSAQTQTNFLG
jgi:hypothetical protein